MTFRGALVSRGMYMGVSIDQMTNDGYFPTLKDHPPPSNTIGDQKTIDK